MISIMVFAITLIAGSVFAATFFHKKFGDILPLSVMGIIIVLYICGLLGFMKIGVYIILLTALSLLILSAIHLIKEKKTGRVLKEEIGLEGLFFLLIYAVLVILNNGRLAWYTDEMYHWMDCVKAMSGTNGFAANYPLSDSIYASYPPGMALFQYFFQKLHEIFDGTVLFSEWRPYVAFQLFAVSLFFPCLRRIHHKKLVKPILFGCAILIPLIMYPGFFLESILIDSIIGVMAGAGFVYLLMDSNRKTSDKVAYISMFCAVLVLMKDAGLFFAVFISATFALYIFLGDKSEGAFTGRPEIVKRIIIAFVPMIASLCAKGSWNMVLNYYHTQRSFSNPIQIGEYFRLFFAGGDRTYKQETVDAFKKAFLDSKGFQIHTGITVSYMLLVLVLVLMTVILTILLVKKQREEGPTKTRRIVMIAILLTLQTVIYIFFLGAVYISSFSAYEATTLASYERYIRMAILAHAIWVFWAALYWIQTQKKRWKYIATASLVVIIALMCPVNETKLFITRGLVKNSLEHRKPYQEIQNVAESIIKPGDRLFYLSDSGEGWATIKFVIRPNRFAAACDTANKTIEDDQWIQDHILESYDYMVVSQADPATVEKFKAFLKDAENLQDGTVYKVNHEDNILERVAVEGV